MKLKNLFKKSTLLLLLLTPYSLFSQSPGGVSSDLDIWLKANAGSSTTTNNAVIDQWTNQVAASTNHATKAGSNYATYSTNRHNFNPSVYFDNGDLGYFDLNLDAIKNSDYNIIAIVERDNSNDASYFLATGALALNQGLHFGYRNNNEATLAQYANDIGTTVPNYNNPQVVTLIHGELDQSSGKTIIELRDNTTNTDSDNNTATLTGSGAGILGRGPSGRGIEGYISEVIVYSSTLTAAEKDKIYSYLAIKYGFTLDNTGAGTNGDYIASNGTLLWDASTNATYHNDVTGIGRDDNSGLSQQKSLNSQANSLVTIDKGGAFGTDNDFIIWGNDGTGTALTTSNTHPSYVKRLEQKWKASVTGTPGTTSVSFNYPNNGNPANYALLLDGTDADFSSGATAHTTGTTINGNVITFTGVTLTDGMYFTLASGSSASPGGGTASLAVWFKADAGMSTTTNGATVNVWNNMVASTTNHATVAGTADYATYSSVRNNYNPSVYFSNGDNGYFDLDLASIKNTNYNIISIVERDNNNDNSYFLGTNTNANNQGLHYGYRHPTEVTLAQYNNDIGATTSYTANTVTLVHGELNTSSGKSIYELRNGSSVSASDGITTVLSGTAAGMLGKGYDNTHGFEGYVSEVIAYSKSLSNLETSKIYSYLAVKYGLTLDNSDYVANNGTVIWDQSNGTAYHNNIVGVGKDSSYELHQKQSKSQDVNTFVFVGAFSASNASNTGIITNDESYIIVGDNNAARSIGGSVEFPALQGIESRIDREWKITNTNFSNTFTMDVILTSTLDVSTLMVLMDDDGNFNDAIRITPTVSVSGNVVTLNIPVSDVPMNSTKFITLATAVIPKPGGIDTDLALWIKADDAGTTIDGQAVPTWSDKSGSGNDATAVTGAKYRGSVFNYNPTLEIDADDNDLAYLTPSFTNQDFYCVANNTNGNTFAGYDGLVTTVNAVDANRTFIFMGEGATTNWYESAGNFRLGTRYVDGDNSSDLAPLANQHLSTGDFDAAFNEAIHIGSDRQNSLDRVWRGNIAEIVTYSTGNSAVERQKIESYLALKYGTTLATNYINSSGITIYDISGYGDDVIGLIRDDASGSLQKQSHSIDDSSRIYLSSLVASNTANAGVFTQESSLVMGHNGEANSNDMVNGSGNTEIPTGLGITDRIEREWKITNTNFNETFTLDINLNTPISDVSHIRVLQDDDGDFSDATIAGVTITLSNAGFGGVLTITGLTVSNNTTKYITIASLNTINPLPVELVDFTAELRDRVVELNWETKSEINNDYFMVERSKDGFNWETLNQVDGAGNSVVSLNYESFDQNPFVETSYYRLKQVDFDGAFKYSSIRAVNFIKTAELEMFPNPAKDILNIVSGSAIETSEIRLFSNLGVNLMNRNRLSINDENKCTIDIYDLPTGMYTILVNGKSFSFVKE